MFKKITAFFAGLIQRAKAMQVNKVHVCFGAALAFYGSGWSPLLGLVVGAIIGVLYTPVAEKADQGISVERDLDTILGAIIGAILGAVVRALLGGGL